MQIARCFRDEDLRADRQPEFTQIDLEISFPTEEEIYALIEGLFARLLPLVGIEVSTPFRRLTYAEAMASYGIDRPDLRFGLEIRDVTALVEDSSFGVFAKAFSDGGVVRAIVIPGGAATSRSKLDAWGEVAKKNGLPGLLTLKRLNGELAFQVKSVLADELEPIAERARARRGGSRPNGRRLGGRRGAGARGAAARARPPARPDPGRERGSSSGSPSSRSSSGTPRTAAGTRPIIRSPAPTRATSSTLAIDPGAGAGARLRRGAQRHRARRRLDPDPRLARCSRASSRCSASPPRRRSSASASCSTPCASALRRTAGSPSASTAS